MSEIIVLCSNVIREEEREAREALERKRVAKVRKKKKEREQAREDISKFYTLVELAKYWGMKTVWARNRIIGLRVGNPFPRPKKAAEKYKKVGRYKRVLGG